MQVITTANAPAASSDDQDAVFKRGMAVGQVQMIWGGVNLIRDEYSLAQDGQIRLLAHVMQDTAMVRAAAYTRVSFHLA